jgi:hypothetical protein
VINIDNSCPNSFQWRKQIIGKHLEEEKIENKAAPISGKYQSQS